MNAPELKALEAASVFNAAPGSYLVLLPDAPRFTIVAATDAYLAATFTRRHDIVGKGIFEVFTDNPHNPDANGVRNLRASLETVLHTRAEHRMADQRYDVWHAATESFAFKIWRPLNKPALAEDGSVHLIFHWVDDVTENARLKEAEADATRRYALSSEELHKSNERFQLLNRATQDAVWDWDLTQKQIWWNEGFKTLFGYRDEEIAPGIEGWSNRLHPDDRERVVNGVNEVIDKGGKNWSGEYRFRKADGSYTHVYDRGYVLYDQQGKAYRMLGSMVDITHQKQMLEATRESEARAKLAIDSARLGTYEIDVAAQYILHSPRTAEIFGLDPSKQHPYHLFRDALFPPDFDIRENAHQIAQDTGELFYEVRISRPDGVLVWIRLNGSVTQLKGSTMLIGTILDITEEKKAAELLEQKIEERTRELSLANQQLQQFTYAASHDLQEPLRKISFFVDRLVSQMGTANEAEALRMADRVRHTVNRMRTLIDDLLNYSNTAQGLIRFDAVPLTEVVQEVLDNIEATIIEKQATVEVQDLPLVCGDQRQLKQLFQNLVSNALKYHRTEQTPQVIISAKPAPAVADEQAMRPMVEIAVTDSGIGFAPDDAERIFGLFQRLHGRSEYEGTGVGLAIAHKVVENHGGRIWAEGRPGEGATFRILLPAVVS